MLASHAQRLDLASRVDGLGYWMAFGSDGGAAATSSSSRPESTVLFDQARSVIVEDATYLGTRFKCRAA